MTLSSNSVTLPDQVKLPYVEQGDPTGVPLLLLHGFAGSWRSYEAVLPHLPRSIRALAPTQRGHGEASQPEAGYRLHDFAGDMEAFLNALEVEAAFIVGHSMGGAVAQRFAIDYPGRTLGLVLVSTRAESPGDPEVQAFWDSTVSRLEDPIDPAFLRQFLDSTLEQPVPQEFLETMVAEGQKVPAYVWRATFANRLQENLVRDLGDITAPTLILWGDQDSRISRGAQATLLAGIKDAHLVIYPGAGHGLLYEEPVRLASDLAAFVGKVHGL